jgi:hypothetical protein
MWLIDADVFQKAIEEKAKRLKNLDTINGLCGSVAILYEQSTVDAITMEEINKYVIETNKILEEEKEGVQVLDTL